MGRTTVMDKVGRTSAILPERYGAVLLRQVRGFEAELVLEPGHNLLIAAAEASGVAVQEDDGGDGGDEHGGRRHGSVGRRAIGGCCCCCGTVGRTDKRHTAGLVGRGIQNVTRSNGRPCTSLT